MRKINYPKHRNTSPVSTRFRSKYRKMVSGCWVWIGGKNEKGYGTFSIKRNLGESNQTVLAHRYAWEAAHSHPGAFCVLHKCDNPPCVNPGHLFLGTRVDNNIDMRAKGRGRAASGKAHGRKLHPDLWPKGEQMHGAKLTEDDVRALRMLYAMGDTSFVKLGKQFGVGKTTVEHIVKRRKWAHVD